MTCTVVQQCSSVAARVGVRVIIRCTIRCTVQTCYGPSSGARSWPRRSRSSLRSDDGCSEFQPSDLAREERRHIIRSAYNHTSAKQSAIPPSRSEHALRGLSAGCLKALAGISNTGAHQRVGRRSSGGVKSEVGGGPRGCQPHSGALVPQEAGQQLQHVRLHDSLLQIRATWPSTDMFQRGVMLQGLVENRKILVQNFPSISW